MPEVHKDPEPLRAFLDLGVHKGQEVPKEHRVVKDSKEHKVL